jgi:CRISPR/Cas system-associated exonuclease Cas4 (RecB family)
VEGLSPTFQDLERTFRATWLSEGFISPEHEAERFDAGLAALRRFHDEEKGKPAPEMVEQRFSFMLGRDRVVGRWDRVDRGPDGAVVIDYKSSALEEDDTDSAQRKATRDLQLLVYALAYERMYNERPAKVALHFLESGQRGEVEPSVDAVSAVRAQISATAGRIRARQFPAEPLKPEIRTCRQCPYERVCPESWVARSVAGTGV